MKCFQNFNDTNFSRFLIFIFFNKGDSIKFFKLVITQLFCCFLLFIFIFKRKCIHKHLIFQEFENLNVERESKSTRIFQTHIFEIYFFRSNIFIQIFLVVWLVHLKTFDFSKQNNKIGIFQIKSFYFNLSFDGVLKTPSFNEGERGLNLPSPHFYLWK